MYALVNGQELLLGPIGFNVRMINSELEELELPERFRVSSSDYQNVPLSITDEVKILPTRNQQPEFDPRYEYLYGPVHEIKEDEVVFNYWKADRTLEDIKEVYKLQVKPERQRRENTTIKVTVNDTEVTVSTDRENRLALTSKVVSGDGPFNFKFANGVWVEVTKADLQTIIAAIDAKVQEAYDWELAKLQEIDACETKEAVYEVEITPPVSNPVTQNA
jgi:hypothetical protein